jgi:ATP-dependent helicase/DNAse subunit B
MVLKDNCIYIVPSDIKNDLLLDLSKEKKLKNIKFFALKEFINNLTFSYDEKAIYYLMKKYNYKYENAKIILDNLYYIEDKKYGNKKLDNLLEVKNDINGLLIYNDYFKNYINDKKIIIYGYDYINKYDLNLLKDLDYETVKKEVKDYKHDIYEFDNIFEEVLFVGNKIKELIDNGISIDKIKIVNYKNEYSFILKEVFNMLNLNINTDKESIYSSKIVKKYIELYDEDKSPEELLNLFDMDNEDNLYVYNKIINTLNKLVFINEKDLKRDILINEFKGIKSNNTKYKNEIEIKSLNSIKDDEYAFLIGFNEGSIPLVIKDEDFLSDKEKNLLDIDDSKVVNNIVKENTINNIKSIKNLVITYKLKTPFEEYYPSNIIEDLNYNVIKDTDISLNNSNSINKLLLGKDLDTFVKYGEKTNRLETLFSNYEDIKYMSYDNKFKGIDKEKMYKYINNNLTLSYSSLENYYKCKFKYYLNSILKLDKYEETFAIFIGNLFHDVLSKCFEENFDFDKEYDSYVSKYNSNNKDKFFFNKLKKDLLFIIDTIKKQYSYSNFKEAKYENRFSINKDKTIKVKFIGFIDKLLIHKYKDKVLLAIIDYKTGPQDIKLTNCYYGLNMQLPIYLYLSKNGNPQAEVVGFYLQKILTGVPKLDPKKDIKSIKEDNLKLLGYSICDEELINEFDSSYEKSEVIKSLEKSSNGFRSYSKLLTKEEMDNLYKLVDKKIDEARDDILEANFEIDPKRIGFDNVSCLYCKYKDICYMNENNIKVLDEVKDLDFLGGDNND